MAQHTGTPPRAGKPERRARGFLRAGGLIGTQMSTNAAKRGYAQARLRALWAEIAGPELAALCRPVRLASARGPAGGLLTLAVSGAHAPQVQMLLPVLRERVNAALGPGAVGRIQLTHAAGAFDEAPNAVTANAMKLGGDVADAAKNLGTSTKDNAKKAASGITDLFKKKTTD
jgi:hypothetical protein